MSIQNPPVPSPSLPPDSEPAPQPSVPDVALWGDSDIGVPITPPARGGKPPVQTAADKANETTQTIGHIGRYALKYRIGEGGLGTVYAAHDPLLSRLIAIKTLNLEIDAEQRPAFNALFLNEARAAAGLSHPNIVTVFDAGISDDNAYIAMELLKGRDLRQLRQEGWKPTPTQAALIVRRVADALAYAHSKGVVHRDIKPANIFMVGRTQPRVLDFGIARVAHQHEVHAGDDVAAGSPYYMAPEQARQQPVDRRADVFSLGVVLYEMLTDQKPFRGNSLAEIIKAVMEQEPPPAHVVNKEVPKALSEIAARAMEKEPEHRFRSARALSRELRHWLDEHGQASDHRSDRSDRRPMLTAIVAASAVLLAAAAWWFMTPHKPEDEETPAIAMPAAAPAPPVAEPASAAPVAAEPAASATAEVAAPVDAAGAAPLATPWNDASSGTPASSAAASIAPAARDTGRERRMRERDARSGALAPLGSGLVRLAVSPWGHVEVDGTPVGTAPPLNEITLSEGRHQVVIRNEDFAPYSVTIDVLPGQPVTLKHKFGS